MDIAVASRQYQHQQHFRPARDAYDGNEDGEDERQLLGFSAATVNNSYTAGLSDDDDDNHDYDIDKHHDFHNNSDAIDNVDNDETGAEDSAESVVESDAPCSAPGDGDGNGDDQDTRTCTSGGATFASAARTGAIINITPAASPAHTGIAGTGAGTGTGTGARVDADVDACTGADAYVGSEANTTTAVVATSTAPSLAAVAETLTAASAPASGAYFTAAASPATAIASIATIPTSFDTPATSTAATAPTASVTAVEEATFAAPSAHWEATDSSPLAAPAMPGKRSRSPISNSSSAPASALLSSSPLSPPPLLPSSSPPPSSSSSPLRVEPELGGTGGIADAAPPPGPTSSVVPITPVTPAATSFDAVAGDATSVALGTFSSLPYADAAVATEGSVARKRKRDSERQVEDEGEKEEKGGKAKDGKEEERDGEGKAVEGAEQAEEARGAGAAETGTHVDDENAKNGHEERGKEREEEKEKERSDGGEAGAATGLKKKQMVCATLSFIFSDLSKLFNSPLALKEILLCSKWDSLFFFIFLFTFLLFPSAMTLGGNEFSSLPFTSRHLFFLGFFLIILSNSGTTNSGKKWKTTLSQLLFSIFLTPENVSFFFSLLRNWNI